MTKMKDANEELDKRTTSTEDKIVAIDYQPIQSTPKRSNVSLNPIRVTIGIALLASILAIWFLLTAKSVIISVEPSQARVNIYGGLNFKLSDNHLLRSGDYSLTASASGYVDLNHKFIVDQSDHSQIKLTMEKMPGHLNLTSKPISSQIFLNTEQIGTTPFNIKSLAPGSYEINLKAPRYKTETMNIKIEGLDIQQNLHVDLKPDWGFIELKSSPKDADIKINGKTIGKTPFLAPILSTGELVSISFPGYKAWSKKLSINAGETKKLSEIILAPEDGIIDLNTNPSGATITVDGEYRGNTPATLYVDAEKEHSISVFLNGYSTQKYAISLMSGARKNLLLNLTPDIGIIDIIVSPKDSLVWIDKKLIGPGDRSLKLASYPQLLEVKKSGFAAYKKIITPQPQLKQILKVQLLTKEEAYWAGIPKEITSSANQILKLFRPKTEFLMGAPRQEAGRRANEVLRKVLITRPFYMATKEITNKQYWKFKKHSSRHFNGKTLNLPNQPVVNVSWEQAALYCNWLSKVEKLIPFYQEDKSKIIGSNIGATGYRLPTEAEWAWVSKSKKIGGESESLQQYLPPKNKSGNFADISAADILGSTIPLYDDGNPTTAAVGSFTPNEKGLYDLQGNVAEWINDFYEIKFNLNNKTELDPLGPVNGELRTIRGSSWRDSDITELRMTYRDMGNDPRDDVGFRIARYIKPTTKK